MTAIKKAIKKRSKKARITSRSKGVYVASPEEVRRWMREANKSTSKDGDDFGPYPIRRNPEPPPEETAKKLAARKALTLRAFQMAYENHHRRRTS